MSPVEGWAELARSDFTLTHANINGGLLSDPTLGASPGSRGGGRTMDDGWAISFFFSPLSSAPLPFFFYLKAVSCAFTLLRAHDLLFFHVRSR